MLLSSLDSASQSDLLKAVLNTAVDGIIAIDRRGRICLFNKASELLFGYEAEEVFGKNVHILMPEPYRSQHDSYIANYQATGEEKIIGIGREVEGRRKDGSTFPMYLSVGEVTDRAELAYVGIVRDITAQRENFRALEDACVRAEIANQAKSEFLSRMSHELRTPLNAVLGFAQILSLSEPGVLSPEKENEYFEAIISSGNHLLGLIEDVLDLSKIEHGQVEVSIAPVDLLRTLRQSITMVQPVLSRYRISIVDDALSNAPMPLVHAVEVRLRQCIMNLLSNGAKYNKPGGKILIKCEITPAWRARLIIEDTGIGIPRERLSELFKPFTRVSKREEVEGSGIGLAITRQFVEQMDGKVSVVSKEGVGSRFALELPLVAGTQTFAGTGLRR